MRVLLVRHAHAGVRGTWPGDDLERELSDKGRRQAAAITRWLGDEPVDLVVSSRAVRCTETVAGTATAHGTTLETAPELLEGTPPATTLGWLEGLAERVGEEATVVACSHGDVIGNVLARLEARGTDGVAAPRWPKASTWDLTVEDGLVVHATWHAAPEA